MNSCEFHLLNAAIFGGIADAIQALPFVNARCGGAATESKPDAQHLWEAPEILQQIEEEPKQDC